MELYNFRLMMVNPIDNTCDLIDRRNVTLDDIDKTKKMFGISTEPFIATRAADNSWIMQASEVKIRSSNVTLLATTVINKVVDQEQENKEEN